MDSLTPGTQATLDRLTAQARAVVERVPRVLPAFRQEPPVVVTLAVPWTQTRRAPVDAALCAQRRADRAQMDADRRRCAAYPATLK